MKLQLLVLASLASIINAQSQDVAALTGLYGDISGHISEYLSYVQDGHSLPAGLLNLYQEVQTYTDDSYTTLLSNVDVGQVESFATGLPWYSSRLETIFAQATEGSGSGSGSSSVSHSSLDSSLVGGSSLVSSITSSASSASSAASSSGGGAGGAGGSGSESGSQSGSQSGSSSNGGGSSGSGAGMGLGEQSSQVVYYLLPLMMVLAAPALL